MTFEEAWEKVASEDYKFKGHSEKALFRKGYEAGYEAAKKEAQRVVSFFED
jgi:hypothetical protein